MGMKALIKEVRAMFDLLDEPDRATVLDALATRYCFACGSRLPKSEDECACLDESDDEEEDDDDDQQDDDHV